MRSLRAQDATNAKRHAELIHQVNDLKIAFLRIIENEEKRTVEELVRKLEDNAQQMRKLSTRLQEVDPPAAGELENFTKMLEKGDLEAAPSARTFMNLAGSLEEEDVTHVSSAITKWGNEASALQKVISKKYGIYGIVAHDTNNRSERPYKEEFERSLNDAVERALEKEQR